MWRRQWRENSANRGGSAHRSAIMKALARSRLRKRRGEDNISLAYQWHRKSVGIISKENRRKAIEAAVENRIERNAKVSAAWRVTKMAGGAAKSGSKSKARKRKMKAAKYRSNHIENGSNIGIARKYQ
jgi:hypothetical protein